MQRALVSAAALIGRVLAAGLFMTVIPAIAAHASTEDGLADFRQSRFAEAFEEWEAAGTAGDPRGALFVGVLYDTGLGVPQSDALALDWYRRAAEAGSGAGAFNVGVMYDAGRGTAQDPAQAASWYARAAAKGFARAEYNLALMYESGSGVARNRSRAIDLYTKAANHGVSAALGHLAALGRPFTGTPHASEDGAMRDFQQAQKLLLARGPAEAIRAVELFRRAAGQRNPLAAYDLGYCYEHGIGMARDPVQAYGWYRRAAADATDQAIRSIASTGAQNLEGQLSPAQRRQADPPH